LVTPDRSGEQEARNTGNNDGVPDTGENTTVTPIAQQNKDDLVYLAKGDKAASLSPVGAGRSGAFKEAKRQSGIPVSKHPDRVTPNYDRRGKLQTGKNYEFDIRDANGKIKTLIIRYDAKGHFFGENDPQNRGPHFNDELDNHYEY
jgi:filamentous hemagglutinin